MKIYQRKKEKRKNAKVIKGNWRMNTASMTTDISHAEFSFFAVSLNLC